jgi:hypothetical protein
VTSALFALCGVVWLAASAIGLWSARSIKRLPRATAGREPANVSVVLAARDEAARLETAVRRLFSQLGVRLEVVVVDDRSRDATPEILARLRSEFAAFKTLRIDVLPGGWLGKCHALARGSELATGEWLLFSDGDVWLAPDAIYRAVAAAERAGADHVALTPHMRPAHGRAPSFLYQACMIPLQSLLTLPLALANRDHPLGFAGIGAFNLVRAARYRAFSGHQPLRLEVADDMKLGLLVRRSGGRTRVFLGDADVQVDWASDVRGIVRALEKNSFAALEYRTGAAAAATLLWAALWLGGLAGLVSTSGAGAFAGFGLLSSSLVGVAQARLTGYGIAAGVALPLSQVFGWITLWNSVVRTLRQGGIYWRDTFYSIEELRRGGLPVR